MWSEVKVQVAQSCLTLCNPIDYTVHEILQARILEWVAFPFSMGFSQPRDWTQVSHIAGRFFTSWATREAQEYRSGWPIPSPADLPYPGTERGLPHCRRRQWHPTPVLLPGKSHGQRSLVGCSPWGREESDMTERLNNNNKDRSEPKRWMNTRKPVGEILIF